MKILITGATGTVGRPLVNLLVENGHEALAVTRNPAAAALVAAARLVVGDPSRPKTLISALDGVEAIFLVPRAAGEASSELLSLAVERGVRRVVVVSAATVQFPAGERRFAERFKAVEEAVEYSGLEWTILRCSDFDANSLAWAPQIRATGVVRSAYGAAATSPIHERDIAAVAERALTDPSHVGRRYLLTGQQSLTQYDKVRVIGETTGRVLAFEELPSEQVRQFMLAQGLPEEIPDRLLGSLADYAKTAGPTSDAVEQLLGRPALTFADWTAEHAAAFQN